MYTLALPSAVSDATMSVPPLRTPSATDPVKPVLSPLSRNVPDGIR
jgi:hypothetical protein